MTVKMPVEAGGQGRMVTVRQMSARRLRHHGLAVQRVMQKLQQLHPEITDWAGTQVLDLIQRDLHHLLDGFQAEIDDMICSATDLSPADAEAMQDLPIGAYVDFLLAVAKVQQPSIEAFSRARQWWTGLLPGANGRTG
jgi:hypothetical protein